MNGLAAAIPMATMITNSFIYLSTVMNRLGSDSVLSPFIRNTASRVTTYSLADLTEQS
jgi:hypothetical protein